jgi:AcrR family transcriptional regulator
MPEPNVPPEPIMTSAPAGAGAPGDEGDDPTRERLLAAAADVFAEKGYDRAGVQEIARRAGFTTGAIYGRFDGKADLLLSALQSQSDSEFDELFARGRDVGFAGEVASVLSTVGTHLVTDEFDNGQALLLEAFVAGRRDHGVASMLRQALDSREAEMTELIDAGKATGVIDPTLDTMAMVQFCHALALGFLLFGAIDRQRPEAGPWQALIDRLIAAVEPPRARPTPPSGAAPSSPPAEGPAPAG